MGVKSCLGALCNEIQPIVLSEAEYAIAVREKTGQYI